MLLIFYFITLSCKWNHTMFSFELYKQLYIWPILIFTMWNSAVRQTLATHWKRSNQFHNSFYCVGYLVFYIDWFTNYLKLYNDRNSQLMFKKTGSCFTVCLKFLLNKDAKYYTKCLWRTLRIACKENTSIENINPQEAVRASCHFALGRWVPEGHQGWSCPRWQWPSHRAWARGTELAASSKSINSPDTFREQEARARSRTTTALLR